MFEFKKCATDDGTEFAGLYEIVPKIFGDELGYFFESYNERDFFEGGLKMRFVQDNQSFSVGGVLRGLHFQKRHPQGKLVRALRGRVLDVALDLRSGKTFGKWHSVVLDSEKQNQFYIPEGFAHGFFVLGEEAVFAYKCTDFYHPEDEGGIFWNDKTIAVDWNFQSDNFSPSVSKKDSGLLFFQSGEKYFDSNGKWIGE